MRLRTVASLLFVASPLASQQIDVTVNTPGVPGSVVSAPTCTAYDSLVPGKHNTKAKLFRATIGDSTVLTSEPLTGSNAERMTPPYFWVSAAMAPAGASSLPARVQFALWTWGYPVFSDKTPQNPHLPVTLDKGVTLDLGELHLDLQRRAVRFADPASYPKGGQIVYAWTSGDTALMVARDRKAKLMLPGGWIGLSDEQRGGMAQVLVGSYCGVP